MRRVLLQTIDLLWVDHLETMEHLRSSVNLRAYGQRDPLVEYKREGLRLFKDLEESFRAHVRTNVPHVLANAQTDAQRAQVARAVETITASSSVPAARRDYERNDKVTITDGTETREMKYKKAEPLLKTGKWKVVG